MKWTDLTSEARLSITANHRTNQANIASTEDPLAQAEAKVPAALAAIRELEAKLQPYYAQPFDGNLRAIADPDDDAARLESMKHVYNEGPWALAAGRQTVADIKIEASALFSQLQEQ